MVLVGSYKNSLNLLFRNIIRVYSWTRGIPTANMEDILILICKGVEVDLVLINESTTWQKQENIKWLINITTRFDDNCMRCSLRK